MTDPVLIVLRKDDVAQLAEVHQRFADDAGIAILRCASDGDGCRCMALETPGPLPRPYDVRSPEITRDMAETIETYHDSFLSAGELSIESNTRGLWFLLPWGQRLFIGLARLHDGVAESRTAQSGKHQEQSETRSCAPLRPR